MGNGFPPPPSVCMHTVLYIFFAKGKGQEDGRMERTQQSSLRQAASPSSNCRVGALFRSRAFFLWTRLKLFLSAGAMQTRLIYCAGGRARRALYSSVGIKRSLFSQSSAKENLFCSDQYSFAPHLRFKLSRKRNNITLVRVKKPLTSSTHIFATIVHRRN